MTYKIAFFGTPDFACPTLESLLKDNEVEVKVVVTQPDRPAGRGAKIECSPIKTLALKHGVPVLQPESIRKAEDTFLKALGNDLDLAIVVAFGQILPVTVLNAPRQGSVNIHASLLPRWRGAAPIQRAIMAGDKESGVCLMRMEAGLDTGPVYVRAAIPILSSDTAGTLHDKLSNLGADLLAKNLHRLAKGEIKPVPQEEDGVTYATKITPTDLKLDWSKSADELERTIRALSPIPGAYTSLQGQRLKIFKAKAFNTEKIGSAGELFQVEPTLRVACGKGALELLELQLEGRKRMSADEFLNGVKLKVGTVLG